MRQISGLVGTALLFASPVFAADPAATPAAGRVFSWTGCYVGADVGSAFDRQHTSINPVGVSQAAVSSDITGNSATGGPHVGCNYQFAPGWVVGLEGDVSWGKLGGAASGPDLFADGTPAGHGGVSWSSNADWVAGVRARLGYAVASNALVYGTGGAAWTRTNYAGVDVFTQGPSLATSFTDTRTGWVAGAGVDWAPWSNNWIVRVEYLHYQFGGVSSTAAFSPGESTTFNFGDLKIDTVRAGVAYKF